MKISAIQNQNSKQGIKVKKMPYTIGTTRDLAADNFSREKVNEVSFKGFDGGMKGGAIGTVVGGLVGLGAVIVTGGTAIPAFLAYFAGIGATTVAGAAIGSKIEDSENRVSNKKDDSDE